MEVLVTLLKRQAGVDFLAQHPHDFRFQRAPPRAKLCQARFGLRTARRLKDRLRIRAQLLPAQPTRRS
jgi:hypothetical protein